MKPINSLLLLICSILIIPALMASDLLNRVEHGYVDNNGVKIHYATLGEGPLVVMIHGYPDFWYTWRHQMEALANDYQVVAVDLRGYNLSDKPKGVENYTMRILIGDIATVIQHFPQQKATVIGHDWGGAIAWQVAIWRPDLVEKLVVLSTPHPRGFIRELRNNTEQHKNSEYARNYQKEDAHKNLTAEGLAGWVTDEAAKPHYIEAFQRSNFEAMLNYYKASFPKQTAGNNQNTSQNSASPSSNLKDIQCPTLALFGLEDKALLASGFNETWEWVDADVTLVSLPGAGHFIQQDAAEMVTRTIKNWLSRDESGNQFKTAKLNPEAPSETEQLGRLVGTWNAEQVIRNRDGSWAEKKTYSEWRWYYILDGHAIQDDWISLPQNNDSQEQSPQAIGTNIRIYNPEKKQWVMAWIDKNSRQLATFTAVFENDTIIMTGTDNRGRLSKITFYNITENAFDWKKEWTADEGNSWFEIAKIYCTRKR